MKAMKVAGKALFYFSLLAFGFVGIGVYSQDQTAGVIIGLFPLIMASLFKVRKILKSFVASSASLGVIGFYFKPAWFALVALVVIKLGIEFFKAARDYHNLLFGDEIGSQESYEKKQAILNRMNGNKTHFYDSKEQSNSSQDNNSGDDDNESSIDMFGNYNMGMNKCNAFDMWSEK